MSNELQILNLAQSYHDYAVELRRRIHMYPEPSFHEFETSKLVKAELDAMGIPSRYVTETGIIADIIGSKDSGARLMVALRADMDALELSEETDVDYKSRRDGFMHACGHDLHTSSLLCAARILNELRDSFNGTVRLIFQPAEELGEGAKAMLEAENFMRGVDAVFGTHVMPFYPAGTVAFADGPVMAACEDFIITAKGKGGHGAMPSKCVDALLVGSAIVMNAQSILARELPSSENVVVTFGTFNAGTRFNIIAETAVLKGTIRSYSEAMRLQARDALTRIAEETAKTFRAEATVEFTTYIPPVINDPAVGATARDAAHALFGENAIEHIQIISGSEDFAWFTHHAPGFFAFVGSGSPDPYRRCEPHQRTYFADENAISTAAAMYAGFAIRFLNNVI